MSKTARLDTNQLLSLVNSAPWAMTEQVIDQMRSVLVRHASGDKLPPEAVHEIFAARDSKTMEMTAHLAISSGIRESESGYDIIGSVARIVIGGVIAPRSSMVNGMSKPRGTSVDLLRAQLEEALADDRVGSILFHVESPGGYVQGIAGLAEEIRNAGKPTAAFAEGLCASAALWLASQANEFQATRDTLIGSIGVYSVIIDSSRAHSEAGFDVEVVRSNDGKGDGYPGTKPTQGLREETKYIVDQHHESFVGDLAAGRGMTPEAIANLGRTRVWLAADAQERGLIDAVGNDIRDLINEMDAKHAPTQSPTGSGRQGTGSRAESHTPPAGGTEGRPQMATDPQAPSTTPAGEDSSTQGTADIKKATDAATKAERDRNLAIDERANRLLAIEGASAEVISKLVAQAKGDGDSPEQFADKALAALAEDNPPTGHAPTSTQIQMGQDERDKVQGALSLALTSKMVDGFSDTIVGGGEKAELLARGLGFQTASAASKQLHEIGTQAVRGVKMSRGSLLQAAAICLATTKGVSAYEIKERYSSDNDLVMAAHSTSDFPHLLANVMEKSIVAYAMEIETFWDKISRRGVATDYKNAKLVTISGASGLLTIPEGEDPKMGTVTDRSEEIYVEPQGRDYSWTIQTIVNDDLGYLSDRARMIADSARSRPDELLAALLKQNSGLGPTMADGKAMFHADHNNLGSAAALGYGNFRTATTKMKLLKDFNNEEPRLIEVKPKVLLVPATLSAVAEDLRVQEFVPGASPGNNERNVFRNRIEDVYSARLDAISETGWYVFADPARVPAFAVRFLNGQETASIVMHEGGSPTNRRFTAWIPGVGVGKVNYEGAYHNPGA